MMRSWRQTRLLRASADGADLSQSIGTSIPAGTNQDEGAWTQLTASTPFQYDHLSVQILNVQSERHLTDIAVGAGGSEQLIVDSMVSEAIVQFVGVEYALPIRIPSGSRIAARTQATGSGGRNAGVIVTGMGGSLRSDYVGASRIIQLGADTTNVGGTNVDPGTTANTKGAWSQLVASLSHDLFGIAVCLSKEGGVAADSLWLIDIGTGAAASEQVIMPNIQLTVAADVDHFIPTNYNFIPLFLDAGQRIAARAQSGNNTVTERNLEVHLLGFVR